MMIAICVFDRVVTGMVSVVSAIIQLLQPLVQSISLTTMVITT
jgi:hypothetical protein